MPNSYFRFKQFTIHQGKSAMKVNTDSCIQGAVVSYNNPANILDIGTGTGILALMMAQRYNTAVVDAVEPDADSADQASSNFLNSPWPSRLRLFNTHIQHFTEITANRYDLILTNPPWYNNYPKSSDNRKNIARHRGSLTWEDLSAVTRTLLKIDGYFFILLPLAETTDFVSIMKSNGFTLTSQVFIKARTNEPAGRIISGFTRYMSPYYSTTIAVYETNDNYSLEFKTLLKDFYLAF